MKVLLAAAVACAVAGLLYLRLDSGAVMSEPAPRLVSLPLAGLAAIFAGGAWAASLRGYTQRAPLLAGLSAGIGGYALLRLLL
jgi:hypothetical protein